MTAIPGDGCGSGSSRAICGSIRSPIFCCRCCRRSTRRASSFSPTPPAGAPTPPPSGWAGASPIGGAWPALSDERLAETIGKDGIDILIDLSGHSAGNRLPVFALRAAPVQVGWLGYSNTTGVEAIDYILADGRVAPPGSEGQFSEAVWAAARQLSLLHPAPPPDVAVSPLPGLAGGPVTFGSFNTVNKLSGPAIACWARVLQAVPHSRLLLKNQHLELADTRNLILDQFRRAGIGPERLELLTRVAESEGHLATYGRLDIALDPFPYNGTTTTCEALWMGVAGADAQGRPVHRAGRGEPVDDNRVAGLDRRRR